MIAHEEYGKVDADSPALSIPSAAATSYASSPESFQENDSPKHSSVRRNLFKIPSSQTDSPEKGISKLVHLYSPPPDPILVGRGLVDRSPGGDSNCAMSTVSITSSQTTAIPAWNLSMKDATERNVEVPLNHYILSQPVPLLSSLPSFASDQTQSPSTPSSSSASACSSGQNHSVDESELRLTKDDLTKNSKDKGEENEPGRIQTKQKRKPSVVMEDPPEEPTSCNAAINLTSGQLAEMFLAFGQSARQRYKGSEQSENTPPHGNTETSTPTNVVVSTSEDTLIGSPPPITKSSQLSESSSGSDKSHASFGLSRVRSLERELSFFKVSSERDAITISSLKHAVDTQKQLNSLKEVEIVDKQSKVQILEECTRTLQKEHEDFLERETELVDTIEILTKELDKVTSLKSVPSDELDRLVMQSGPGPNKNDGSIFDIEAKLKDSRVEEQKARIAELEKALQEKEKENFDLRTKIDCLNSRLSEESIKEQDDLAFEVVESDTSNQHNGTSSSAEVEGLLKHIMKRLEVMENAKNVKELPEENNDGNKRVYVETEHDSVRVDITDNPNAIEAMPVTSTLVNCTDLANHSNWCCDWSIVSGH